MAPWKSVAVYECASIRSMDPWAATKKALHWYGGDPQLLSESLPSGCFSRVSRRLGRELFTLPICYHRCQSSHELQPRKLYRTCSVAVISAHVQFPTQQPHVRSFTYAWQRTIHLARMLSLMSMEPKKLYHTRSVAVTQAPVRFPTQRPLVPRFK